MPTWYFFPSSVKPGLLSRPARLVGSWSATSAETRSQPLAPSANPMSPLIRDRSPSPAEYFPLLSTTWPPSAPFFRILFMTPSLSSVPSFCSVVHSSFLLSLLLFSFSFFFFFYFFFFFFF